MPLPKDPFILFSMINMKLRDSYSSLDALCDDMHENKDEMIRTLSAVGFEYDEATNSFK